MRATLSPSHPTNPPIAAWIGRRFPPAQLQHFQHHNIFIVPSLYLLLLLAVIVILWVMSVQFLLNLGYLLVFMLVGVLIMAMMHTFRNLNGLSIECGDFPPVFLGEHAGCAFELANATNEEKRMIDIVCAEQTTEVASVPASGTVLATIMVTPHRRGFNTLPRISLRTFTPMGFFVAWSYFNPKRPLLAYPRPIITPMPFSLEDQGEDRGVHEVPGRENVVGVREYQQGDPLNLLSWKHIVGRDLWVSKMTTQSTGGKTLQFDWQQTTFADTESKLSQLCGWLVTAHQNADAFGLRLPQQLIPVDSGAAHLRRCLEALAHFEQ